jgi:hypothetical protein
MGLQLDLANRDPSVPFGGRLGRREPLAISDREILSSADLSIVEGMLATAAGDAPGLADDPAFRALATAPADDLTIIQATLLPGAIVLGALDLAGAIGATPDQVETLLADLEALEPLPAPAAVAIVDGASANEQVVTIALAYHDGEDATRAADVIAERLRTVRSIRRDEPLGIVLEERGLTGIATRVTPPAATTSAAAIVELRAPLAGDEPTDSGRLAPSSALYRLFVDLVYSRDLLWLAPTG